MEIGAGNKNADIDPDLDRGITGMGRGSGVGIVHVRVHAQELTINERDLTDGVPVQIEDSAVLDIISVIIQSRIIVI